jgi:hypothetical protein
MVQLFLGQPITDVAGNNDITWERTFQTNFGVDLLRLIANYCKCRCIPIFNRWDYC